MHDSEASRHMPSISEEDHVITDVDDEISLSSIKIDANLTTNFDLNENLKSMASFCDLNEDVNEKEDKEPLLQNFNVESKSTKAISDSFVLAKELTLVKEHNSWATFIMNSGNNDNTIILKGSLDKYRPAFWPFSNGVLRYQFNDPVTEQGGVLRIEEKKRKWNSLSKQMTICKYGDANWKEIGNLGKTRRGYNVFDGESHKIFKIRKIWKLIGFKKKITYSVRKIVLKDDILGSGCGTIEVDDDCYPEPISFKLKYSPSPGDFEEISLLVAVMFRMLIDSIVTF